MLLITNYCANYFPRWNQAWTILWTCGTTFVVKICVILMSWMFQHRRALSKQDVLHRPIKPVGNGLGTTAFDIDRHASKIAAKKLGLNKLNEANILSQVSFNFPESDQSQILNCVLCYNYRSITQELTKSLALDEWITNEFWPVSIFVLDNRIIWSVIPTLKVVVRAIHIGCWVLVLIRVIRVLSVTTGENLSTWRKVRPSSLSWVKLDNILLTLDQGDFNQTTTLS